MSGFSADWLSLREPVDQRARSPEVLLRIAAAFANHSTMRIMDLASGTGSTLRALAPHLPSGQHWRLTDHDEALVERCRDLMQNEQADIDVDVRQCDLSGGIDALLDEPVDLITTSAFLDLVSAEWIDAMIATVTSRKIPFYAALSYDGRIACKPAHDLDTAIAEAVNQHQISDKGFGPALGPAAATHAIEQFKQAGYAVAHGPSDWRTINNEQAFQHQLVSGWAQAAREIGEISAADIDTWLTVREIWIETDVSELTVGHVDLFASPQL